MAPTEATKSNGLSLRACLRVSARWPWHGVCSEDLRFVDMVGVTLVCFAFLLVFVWRDIALRLEGIIHDGT